MIPLKWCYKCRQDLPLESFTASKRDKSGVMCSTCQQAYSRAHYQANREKRLKQTGEYQRTHPEQRQAYNRKAYAKNPEYYAEWQRQHPESTRAARQRWYANHPDRVRAGKSAFKVRYPTYYAEHYAKNKERYRMNGA